jgi:hypothetical protein
VGGDDVPEVVREPGHLELEILRVRNGEEPGALQGVLEQRHGLAIAFGTIAAGGEDDDDVIDVTRRDHATIHGV